MKLAEALIERADLKTKIRLLNNRLINNAVAQEGVNPSEKPQDLLKELDEILERMKFLIIHINKTNEQTKSKTGKTISELIAERDVLTEKHKILTSFAHEGSMLVNRVSHSEIKQLATFNVGNIQKTIDLISKQIRETDTIIQELNWLTELI